MNRDIDLRLCTILPSWKLAELMGISRSCLSHRVRTDPDLKAAEWGRGKFKVAVLRQRGLITPEIGAGINP